MGFKKMEMRICFESYDDVLDLSELEDSPYQATKHPDDQIEDLAKIMAVHGVRHPIHLVSGTKQICFGHGRKMSALKNGWTKFPVVYQSFKSKDELFACVQSDNAIAMRAEMDFKFINEKIASGDIGPFDIELLGIKDFDVSPKYSEENEDDIPEVSDSDKRVKSGDLFVLGDHRLLCGDSTNKDHVAILMDGNKADMLCWDPPWNVGFEYNEYEDDKSEEEYGKFLFFCLENFYLNAKDSFVAVVWQSEKNWTNFHKWFPKTSRIVAVTKNFVQLSKGFLQRAWDPAFIWHGTNYIHINIEGHNQRDYFLSNTAATHNNGDGIRGEPGAHPCPRQVDAYEYFINGWSKKRDIVVDLSGGSGTAIIASDKNGRRCFSIEIDPHYCAVILDRWAKYTGKDPVREDGKKWSEISASS